MSRFIHSMVSDIMPHYKKTKKTSIKKLRMILDNPSADEHKKMISENEVYLKSIHKRLLGESSDKKMRSPAASGLLLTTSDDLTPEVTIHHKKEEKYYGLSEYRVDKIDSIKIFTQNQSKIEEQSKILLGKKNYDLIDKIGDGYKSTVSFDFSDQTELRENSVIEVSYEYWHDEKKQLKKNILIQLDL